MSKIWNKTHKEEKLEIQRKYRKTPIGKAFCLLDSYKRNDKKYNRGEGNLTAQWIVDNIFAKPCVHCGETDWTKMGCNRIDNSLPHTKDNVEPCCKQCNWKLAEKERKRNNIGQFI